MCACAHVGAFAPERVLNMQTNSTHSFLSSSHCHNCHISKGTVFRLTKHPHLGRIRHGTKPLKQQQKRRATHFTDTSNCTPCWKMDPVVRAGVGLIGFERVQTRAVETATKECVASPSVVGPCAKFPGSLPLLGPFARQLWHLGSLSVWDLG